VASCAVVFGLAIHYEISRCDGSVWLFSLVSGLVIFLGSAANLATVANTIAIERDWVVVIADKNKDTLASKLLLLSKSSLGSYLASYVSIFHVVMLCCFPSSSKFLYATY